MTHGPHHGVVLALCLLAGSPQAAPRISPDAGSNEILALRAGEQPELRLTYKVERPGAPVAKISFGLSTDYDYKDTPSDGRSLDDYRLKRLLRMSNDGRLFNDSLYAIVWFRGAELDNRANINAALAKGGLDSAKAFAPQNPFWAESTLGVTTAKFPRPELKRTQAKNRISWTFGGEEVFAIRYRDEPVPAVLRPHLRRWWPTVDAIHPAIVEELAQSGKVPAELWVREIVPAKSFETAHWTLTESAFLEAAKYPLAAGLIAAPTGSPNGPADASPEGSQATYTRLFRLLTAIVAEKRVPPSQDDYAKRADAALAHGNGLEAVLWTLEMQLAAGPQISCPPGGASPAAPSPSGAPASAATLGPSAESAAPGSSSTPAFCTLLAKAAPAAKADPRTAVAFAPRSPDARVRGQFDPLPNAYLLRLLWATRPPGNGVTRLDTERDLEAALSHSPVANFCKDAGDFYVRGFRPFEAWQVWDLGRAMAGHRTGDFLDEVDKLEGSLEHEFPMLF